MKILITITKGNIGGAQIVVLNMAKSLKERGHFVVVGLGEGEFLKDKLNEINIPVNIFKTLKRTNNPLENLKFIYEMKKYVDKEKFDVVHFNSSNTLLGAIGVKISDYKIKTVFTFHGLSTLDSNYSNTISKIIYWIIFKFLLIFINENIFVSYDNLKKLIRLKLIKKGTVIYNGLDSDTIEIIKKTNAIKMIEGRINHSIKNSFIIGSIGRFSREKNYEFLISIFPKILEIKKESVCVIIGDDSKEKAHLENLVTGLGLKDKVFLISETERATKYIKIFDLFVLPSLYEGLSVSLIETLFAEIPAIASDVGGNKEILNDNFTYKLNNNIDFLELFKKVYCNKIKQDFEKQKPLFSTPKMIDKLERMYK